MAAGSYTHKCRIGNWSEDHELEQLRLKDFLTRKGAGDLLITKYQQKMNHSLHSVALSGAADGMVHFGDTVVLYSCRTQGILSNDIGEKVISCGQAAYPVTTSTVIRSPTARNTFVIEPVVAKGQPGRPAGTVLRFGDNFRLRAYAALVDQPVYLHSQPVSPLSASKYSRNQEVLLHPAGNSFDTVWKASFKDKNFRFEMDGEPVPSHAELLIIHSQTMQALCSDLIKYENDFGTEFEVCVKTFAEVAKNQTMKQEFQGEITPQTAQRSEIIKNHWAFITAKAE